MSGMSLSERLRKYHTIFEQRVQTSPGVTAVYGQQTRLFLVLPFVREEACFFLAVKGGLDG